jgi:hypothetical protein
VTKQPKPKVPVSKILTLKLTSPEWRELDRAWKRWAKNKPRAAARADYVRHCLAWVCAVDDEREATKEVRNDPP